MKTKGFSLVVIVLAMVHFSTAKSNVDLTNINISDDYFSKYMQQSVKRDLEKVNLLDRLVSTPPHRNSQHVPEILSSKSSSKSLRKKNSKVRSRKLDDLESTYESLYSPDYTSGVGSSMQSIGSDSTSRKLNSEH